MTSALEVKDLVSGYGNVQVLNGAAVRVEPGEIVTIVGPNGAGKSTLLKVIVGVLPVWKGSVALWDTSVEAVPVYKRAGLGVGYVPEGTRIWGTLTVRENLQLGAYLCKKRREVDARLEQVLSLFPILGERLKQPGASLSGGQRQMLAIGRGLMSAAPLLLLDEPSLGLAPLVVAEMFEKLRLIRQLGTTLLLVEQNAGKALDVADRAYVMTHGQMAMSGTVEEIRKKNVLLESYLGVKEEREPAGSPEVTARSG
jgi:branched-chain amino acid transport system ATP-binding protein